MSVGAGLLLALGPGAVALPVAVPAGLFLGWLHERAVDSPAASARPGGARDRGAPRPRGAVGLGGFVVRELCVQFAVNLALLGVALVVLWPLGTLAWAVLAGTAFGSGLWAAVLIAPWFGVACWRTA